ncbi:SMI1/KNR4 family protein [Streptomyces sp. NPDC051569]|uniref:SMI1/KNR4 family protein n=1 Tax=Streptomyces sp. NPDC051569 TaxID=3365661 RepID=UPI00379F859A
MESNPYLDAVVDMLGEPAGDPVPAGLWSEMERELGFELPADYKAVIEGYAPVRLNEHLYLHHPASEVWNLARWMRETVQAWSEIDWDVDELEEDPRTILGVGEIRFGVREGLTPLLVSDRGETVFLSYRVRDGYSLIFVENGDGEFYGYSMSFAEWLCRYLSGEDVNGPNSAIFYPGPVKFTSLPMDPGESEVVRFGPERTPGGEPYGQ